MTSTGTPSYPLTVNLSSDPTRATLHLPSIPSRGKCDDIMRRAKTRIEHMTGHVFDWHTQVEPNTLGLSMYGSPQRKSWESVAEVLTDELGRRIHLVTEADVSAYISTLPLKDKLALIRLIASGDKVPYLD